MTLFTIGMPVFNAMPFLPEAVESLLRQTVDDFELLIIDDGSTDESPAYLKSVRDPRVRLLSQPNRGITQTLNRMLELAAAPWLVRHDADDVARPWRLEVLREAIASRPDAGMIYTRASYMQQGRSFTSFRTTAASPEQLRGFTRLGYLLSICHPTVALNVAAAKAAGGYRFDLHVEDVDLWWRMALRTPIMFVPRETLDFRLNAGSISSRSLEQQALHTLFIQYLLLSSLWGLEARAFDSVAPVLRTMLDESKLTFRAHIRRANIHLGARSYLSAVWSSIRAFAADPRSFSRRLLYEAGRGGPALLGENPLLFAERAEELWGPIAKSRAPASRHAYELA